MLLCSSSLQNWKPNTNSCLRHWSNNDAQPARGIESNLTVNYEMDHLERRLRERLGDRFDLKYELLPYDITSTYFGGPVRPPIRRRGYSRESRPDASRYLIGLVVTEDGFPLGYEVFASNRNDSTTVDEMFTAMERNMGRPTVSGSWIGGWSARRTSVVPPEHSHCTSWA